MNFNKNDINKLIMNFKIGDIISNGKIEYEVRDIQKNALGNWVYILYNEDVATLHSNDIKYPNGCIRWMCEQVDREFVLSDILLQLKKQLDDNILDKCKKIAYNIVKNNKNKTIDIMINLLEFAKILPIFSVDFKIKADNDNIELYLLDHVKRYDGEGKRLSNKEIIDNYNNTISEFHNSKDYTPNGKSMFTLRKCFTVQDINYDNIYNLVAGKLDDMPDDYEFIGEITLSKLDNV